MENSEALLKSIIGNLKGIIGPGLALPHHFAQVNGVQIIMVYLSRLHVSLKLF